MRSLVAATACVLLLAACGSGEGANSGATSTASDGKPAATSTADAGGPQAGDGERADLAFTGVTFEGKPFSGESLAGKPAVLWFWAPWCSTCRAQAPNVSRLGAKYRGPVTIVGVAGLATKQAIDEVAPTIDDITHLVDPESNIWNHFGVKEQSSYTVINADGIIVSEGYLNDEKINRLIARVAEQRS